MSISERARDLAERIGPIYGGTEEIEQALLAERRLAMEEAIASLMKRVNECGEEGCGSCGELTAAAKFLATPRGGE